MMVGSDLHFYWEHPPNWPLLG